MFVLFFSLTSVSFYNRPVNLKLKDCRTCKNGKWSNNISDVTMPYSSQHSSLWKLVCGLQYSQPTRPLYLSMEYFSGNVLAKWVFDFIHSDQLRLFINPIYIAFYTLQYVNREHIAEMRSSFNFNYNDWNYLRKVLLQLHLRHKCMQIWNDSMRTWKRSSWKEANALLVE